MRAITTQELEDIARLRAIKYEPLTPSAPKRIASRLSRKFAISQKEMYAKIANLEDHVRLFSHLKALKVIDSASVGGVIGKNQAIVVEGVAEGGSRLGIKLLTMDPPNSVHAKLLVNPFTEPPGDKKSGSILWTVKPAAESPADKCWLTCESDFEIEGGEVYVRGLVDHIWMDFVEKLMIDVGELAPENKLTNKGG